MTLELRPLSPALQQKAIDELNENPTRIAEDLQMFREWILKQPHIRSRLDDQFLIAFLRGSKYSLEKAKKKLDGYYTMRTNFPELFESLIDEQRARAILRMCIEEIVAAGEETLMKYREYLAEQKQYGTDEKLRPGQPINFDAIFGVDGTFRKLEVD